MRQDVARTAAKSLAAAVMGAVVYVLAGLLLARLGTEELVTRVSVVLVPGVIGGVIYYLILRALRVPETDLLIRLVRRIGRRKT